MKKLLLFSACAIWTISTWAQLSKPILTSPSDNAAIVDVNIRMTWNPALGGTVAGYQAEISTDSLFGSSTLLPISGTSAKASELDYNTEYFWRVRGIDPSSTAGAWSDVWSFTTFHDQFTGLTPSGAGRFPKLTVRWDTVAGSTGYVYQLSTDSLFTNPVQGNIGHVPSHISSVGKLELPLENLIFNQTYYYKVYAEHSKDKSGWSSVNNFTIIDEIVLENPFDAAIDQEPKLRLDCDNTPGVTEYRFAVDDSTDFNPASPEFRLITVFDNSFPSGLPYVTVERLLFGKKYYWRVQGVNNASTSSWSAHREFTVLDEATLRTPADGATDVSNKDADFTWDRIKGAEKYQMQYDTVNTFITPTSIITLGDTSNKVTLNLPQFKVPYHWRVRAIHSKDTSNWSSVFSFSAVPTGIASSGIAYSFEMYPNPADNFVNIDFTAKKNGLLRLELYNIVGEKVDSQSFGQVSGKEMFRYDLSKLNTGLYMIVFDLDGERITKRLTVK